MFENGSLLITTPGILPACSCPDCGLTSRSTVLSSTLLSSTGSFPAIPNASINSIYIGIYIVNNSIQTHPINSIIKRLNQTGFDREAISSLLNHGACSRRHTPSVQEKTPLKPLGSFTSPFSSRNLPYFPLSAPSKILCIHSCAAPWKTIRIVSPSLHSS